MVVVMERPAPPPNHTLNTTAAVGREGAVVAMASQCQAREVDFATYSELATDCGFRRGGAYRGRASGGASRTTNADFEPSIPVSEDEPCSIMYTSGTTGQPKGVVHSHASHIVQVRLRLRVRLRVRVW